LRELQTKPEPSFLGDPVREEDVRRVGIDVLDAYSNRIGGGWSPGCVTRTSEMSAIALIPFRLARRQTSSPKRRRRS
jgi:hypothetical protein